MSLNGSQLGSEEKAERRRKRKRKGKRKGRDSLELGEPLGGPEDKHWL